MKRVVHSLLLACALGGCVETANEVRPDVARSDARGDGVAAPDAARSDGGLDGGGALADAGADAADAFCIPTTCAATERCFDGLDNDCDGMVDDGCACIPGTTARCLPGALTNSAPLCGWGEMTCTSSGEFGTWGPCTDVGRASDAGMSSYGCRRIGIMGAPGVNPSSNFQDFLRRQGAIATRFHDTDPSTPVGPELLGTYDIVIVDQLLRGYSADESTALRTWVEAGGGLVVLTGHTRSVGHVHNTLLQSFSVSYNANNLISGPATLLRHPLTLAESGDVLPPVTFLGGYHVGEGPGAPAGLVPFATVADMPVGLAGPVGMGRVVFWGDEWIEFDSEWGTMPAITRLWFNIVRWTKPDPDIAPRCGD